MYISKLVEGMNEDEFMEDEKADEWKTYKVSEDSSSSRSKYKKYSYKQHSSLSQLDTDA